MKINCVPVTVIIPTRNEERNIAECISSVVWASQIFVVDSQSSDRTVEIARTKGVEVVDFIYEGGWPKKKNWAIKNLPIQNSWILLLDADERVTEELAEEISCCIKSDDKNGYYIKWKFYFLGKWMRFSWSHGWMLRLFKRGTGEYEDLGLRNEGGWDNEVHENLIVEGDVGKLSNYLLHKSNQDLFHWLKKQNEFSDWNAHRRLMGENNLWKNVEKASLSDPLSRRRLLKSIFLKLPGKPFILFVYLYVFKLGFLDGREGFYFCLLRATHELNIGIKVFELRKNS